MSKLMHTEAKVHSAGQPECAAQAKVDPKQAAGKPRKNLTVAPLAVAVVRSAAAVPVKLTCGSSGCQWCAENGCMASMRPAGCWLDAVS